VDSETRFRAVFELAYAPLCRYARHRGLTGPDAEDLVAQTLEIAWRRIGDVPATEPLPWLYAVAHNVWRNTARRDRRRRELRHDRRVVPFGAFTVRRGCRRSTAGALDRSCRGTKAPGLQGRIALTLGAKGLEVYRQGAWQCGHAEVGS
jgi:DNA-directed RNA polymerase specialized sigma24 family protein